MWTIALHDPADFAQWREQARALLLAEVEPEQVVWQSGESDGLFGGSGVLPPATLKKTPNVPRDFLNLANAVLAHSDERRHAVLYRMLYRLTHGEPGLLDIATDADMVWAQQCSRQVSRDMHKMKAFVRFREISEGEGEGVVYVAWFEPSHDIVTRVAPFFVRRFTGMRWSILTPARSAHWDGETLRFGDGAKRSDAPRDDVLEDLWRTYYASIFNPARLKVDAMRSEMPVKYWKNLPEAQLIPQLIREAMPRMQAMVDQLPTIPRKKITPLPERALPVAADDLGSLRLQARDCRACELWQPATQTVFGEGPAHARIMLIGEQPGDQEDLAGKPFIGPAGQLLDEALAAAGIERSALYVTNAVKHFRFEPRGKVRLHKRATARQQAACQHWLLAELASVQPRAVVCLGAMAAQAIFGPGFRLMEQRGQWLPLPDGRKALATVHPSWLLRLPDEASRAQAYAEFVQDLARMTEID